MSDEKLGLFKGEDMPSVETVWSFYEDGLKFNTAIDLDETVRANENFFVGKQWEGVQANGLPTPVFNVLKRVVGFHVATITTDNLRVNATALANSLGTEQYEELVRVVNEEMEAIMEFEDIPAKIREFARDASVRGDGCLYVYWDPTVDVDLEHNVKGVIRCKKMSNTRVFFGDPNVQEVQSQPYIQIISRRFVRDIKKSAKFNGSPDWEDIKPDDFNIYEEDANKRIENKATVVLTLWRSEEDGTIWGFESTLDCVVNKPWSLGIRKYPIVWMPWDEVADSYHGEAMITGLIPNQIFINKAYAMSMLSMMRTAWPKIIYDGSRVSKWDNRIGGAIKVEGDVNTVAKILDPAQISPQIAQFIQMAIEETQESLGATASALGEGKAYNTSAILSLQRAAATPTEMTKQRLYKAVEELFYIILEFMGEYYGERYVDMPTPELVEQAFSFVGQQNQIPDEVPMPFDFGIIKQNPMVLKLDVGASSYYSEIAAMQTLDNLLQMGQINIVEYLERVPDSYVPGRRKLIATKEAEIEMQKMQQAMMMGLPPGMMGGGESAIPQAGVGQPGSPEGGGPVAGQLETGPEITGGRGYHSAAREVNGDT